jgi:DNA ligase (NAD+)
VAIVTDVDAVIEHHARWSAERDALDYEIDGMVIKLDDLKTRERLGATVHHPRWAMAYKFAPRHEVTRVEDIVIQVGRTGILTPVALLHPIEVGGVTVSRASLHNREVVQRKDVRVGDLVRIQRAGDVIPEVGAAVARDLADHFRSLDAVRHASRQALEATPEARHGEEGSHGLTA